MSNSCVQCNPPSYYGEVSRACVYCPTGSYFNATYHSCLTFSCPAGLMFNQSSWTCEQPPQNVSNFSGSNWYSNSPFQTIDTAINSINNGSQVCPVDFPYSNGTACIQCTAPLVFNADTKVCTNCPAGTYFNATLRKCSANIISYITNPNSPNLISGGYTKSQITTAYEQTKAANPNLQDCPPSTPYFNGAQCINCAFPYPYFDMYYK